MTAVTRPDTPTRTPIARVVAASVVFGDLFFPKGEALTGTLLSFATFAVGFFARPIGGVIFGHYGDRIGRKKLLVLSLLTMGVATVAPVERPSRHIRRPANAFRRQE